MSQPHLLQSPTIAMVEAAAQALAPTAFRRLAKLHDLLEAGDFSDVRSTQQAVGDARRKAARALEAAFAAHAFNARSAAELEPL